MGRGLLGEGSLVPAAVLLGQDVWTVERVLLAVHREVLQSLRRQTEIRRSCTMLAELVAVDEIFRMGNQVDRAGLLEHGRSQRGYRILPARHKRLTDF